MSCLGQLLHDGRFSAGDGDVELDQIKQTIESAYRHNDEGSTLRSSVATKAAEHTALTKDSEHSVGRIVGQVGEWHGELRP